MAAPMRIRAKLLPNAVEVKVLIRHDMETGKRKDSSGKIIPPHFIKTLVVKHNDRIVLDTVMGIAVSKDPFLSFRFKDGAEGDKVTATWVDNIGDTRTDETTIV